MQIIKINFSCAGSDFNIFNWPTKLSTFNATIYFENFLFYTVFYRIYTLLYALFFLNSQ